MEVFGLITALFTLMFLALRGVNVIFSSLLCSLLVMVTNDISIIDGFAKYYVSGPVGAFTFASKFFILLVTGAMFGRVMAESGSANSLALLLTRHFGIDKTLIVIMLSTALLTYGGVTVFIAIFALYPLSIRLLHDANIPKRLFMAAFFLGGTTFTLTAVPGTPSIHNIISASALGTDLFAGAWLGIVASIVMLILGLIYLEWQRKLAIINGESFKIADRDKTYSSTLSDDQLPSPFCSLLPLLVVLSLIIFPRLISMIANNATIEYNSALSTLIETAMSQPILWPSFCLFIGSILVVVLSSTLRHRPLLSLGGGAQDAVAPLINTAAVVGFGSVVVQTHGFEIFSNLMIDSDIPPLWSIIISSNITSGIVGSSSGGLQIFMETLAPGYINLGVDKETLHRLATMASGGLDSLPHSGGVIAFLTVCSMSHKEAYKDIAIVSIVIPMIAVLFVTWLAYLVY